MLHPPPTKAQVADVLNIVFRGPPPAHEAERVAAAFASGPAGGISKARFVSVIRELQGDDSSGSSGGGASSGGGGGAAAAAAAAAGESRLSLSASLSSTGGGGGGGSAADREAAAHFDSFGALKDARQRQTRAAAGPTELFTAPLTAAHDVGWHAKPEDTMFVRHPKKHCAETKFAAALHSSGYM